MRIVSAIVRMMMDMILIMMMKMIIGSLSIVSISLLFENPGAFIILESESNFTRRVSNLFKICFPRFLNFPFSQLKKDSTEFFEMRILLIMIIMLMLLLLDYCIFRIVMFKNVVQCSVMFCNVQECCVMFCNVVFLSEMQRQRTINRKTGKNLLLNIDRSRPHKDAAIYSRKGKNTIS